MIAESSKAFIFQKFALKFYFGLSLHIFQHDLSLSLKNVCDSWCMHQTGFSSAAVVPQSKFNELCSSAAIVSQSKSTELCSLAAVVPQSRGTQRRFLPNAVKKRFRLSRVILDLYKCILSGAIKFYLFGRPRRNLSLFEITKASVLFSRKF